MANPLRKIIGEKVFDEWPKEDWVEMPDGWCIGIPYEELECGHKGMSILGRGDYFGPCYAKSRRCAECGKESANGK